MNRAEVPALTPSEFKRGYLAFQARESRDAMYWTATFLVNHYWGKPYEMADSMGVLLLTWNQALYRYGAFDFARLEATLRARMEDINNFQRRDILSLEQADEPVIEQLFTEFLDALQIAEGRKKGTRSPVAVAKALHLLAPGFFPLWDALIAKAYGCCYDQKPARKYLAFAYRMQVLAQRLQEHVPPESKKSFLKLIDEYNYARYTRGWI